MQANVQEPQGATLQLNLCLSAGVLLAVLLPIGSLFGLGSCYLALFCLHLVFLLWALAAALRYLWQSSVALLFARPLLVLFLILVLVFAFLPVTSRDALIHHLAVPRWWVEAGKIHEVTWHEWSYYPMLINLGFNGFVLLGVPRLASLYHCFYLILLAALVGLIVERHAAKNALGPLAALLLLYVPLALRLSISPLVDLGIAFYSTLALYYVSSWLESGKNIEMAKGGAALGLALSTKYNGLLVFAVLVPLCLVAGLNAKLRLKTILSGLVLVLLCSLIVYSPWLIKNYVQTANPLYPLYKQIFSPAAAPAGPSLGLPPLARRQALYEEGAVDIALLPFRMFISGQDNDPRRFDGVLNPLLLLGFLPLLCFRRDRRLFLYYLFGLFYVILALLQTGARTRYLVPALGSLVVTTVIALEYLRPKQASQLIYAGLAFSVAWAAIYVYTLGAKLAPFQYIFTKQSDAEYLSRRLPEYALIEYANKNIAKDEGLYLLLTGNQFYYYAPRVFSSGHLSAAALLDWINKASSAEDLAQSFMQQKLSFILTQTERLKETLMTSHLSAEKLQLWNAFQSSKLRLLQSANGFSLWKVD